MQRRLSTAGVIAVFATLSIATLVSVWREPGWPFGHDGRAFAQRTYIYVRHWSALDLFPIWSSTDASGFGSPMPLMYHKLFYFVAALLALATGSIKFADATTVAVMLTVGAAGVYATMRAIGASRLAGLVAGCCLIAANYTVTDWLVRGAVAESSGAMVTTWALYFFVRAIQSGRLGAGIGFTFAVLWLGHSVLAYYVGWILGVTFVTLACLRAASWSVLNPRTAWRGAVVFLLVLAPYLVAMAVLSPGYDFSRIVSSPLRPRDQFVSFGRYFWDTDWHFGKTAAGLTVQLDLAMVWLLAFGLAALAWRWFASRPAPASGTPSRRPAPAPGTMPSPSWRPASPSWRLASPSWRPALAGPDVQECGRQILRTVAPFLIIVCLGLLLQCRAALFVYEKLPGAAYVQFPWRLLALITPAVIVAAVFLADQALPDRVRLFSLGAAAAWMIAGSGAFVPLTDARLALDEPPYREHKSFSGFREYEPRAAQPVAETLARIGTRWAQSGCSFDRLDAADEEALQVRFRTVCGRSETLPLPLYSSPLHAVEDSTYHRAQPCLPLLDFPAVCGAIVPSSNGIITVRLPTIAAIPRLFWQTIRATTP